MIREFMSNHTYFIEDYEHHIELRRRNKEDTHNEHVAFILKKDVDIKRICEMIEQLNND